MKINNHTFKIELVNIKAMIEGFRKDDENFHVSIYTAHKSAHSIKNDPYKFPKVITPHSKKRKEYPLSAIGKSIDGPVYKFDFKYLAVIDRIFYLKENNIKMWEELCTNGIYDIWEPEAPYNNLKDENGQDKKAPQILLLRIFEINKIFNDEVQKGSYSDMLPNATETEIQLVRPIISNEEYKRIITKIRKAVERYLDEEKSFFDTSNLVPESIPIVKEGPAVLASYRDINTDIYAPTADEDVLSQRVSNLRRQGLIGVPRGIQAPQRVSSAHTAFVRDPSVKAWVLENAKGICEGCSQHAPFILEDGTPFLEVHHVCPLADGGSDRTINAVALCPNCHRRCHLSSDREDFAATLYKTISRLVPE